MWKIIKKMTCHISVLLNYEEKMESSKKILNLHKKWIVCEIGHFKID